jgi:hypothetical protein
VEEHERRFLAELPGLGFGSMSAGEISAWIARTVLFRRMTQIANEDIIELRDRCIDPYVRLLTDGNLALPRFRSDIARLVIRKPTSTGYREILVTLSEWSHVEEAAPYDSTVLELRSSVLNWAAERHIVADWMLEACWRNITIWGLLGDRSDKPNWDFSSFLMDQDGQKSASGIGLPNTRKIFPDRLPAELLAPVPNPRPYNPIAETRGQYLKRVQAEFKNHCDRQEEAYSRLGFSRTRPFRGSGTPMAWKYIDWFIHYQIQKLTCGDIAARLGDSSIDDSTVYKGLKSVEGVLGVKLRPKSKRRARNLK